MKLMEKPIQVKVMAPWGDGLGTMGLKVGRFYADIFWSDWSSFLDDDGNFSLRQVISAPSRLIPSGIFVRLPWVCHGERIIGGGGYHFFFRRFWRGFRRSI